MEIKGKVALVTGGAHRVGRAMMLALAKAGANIVINYRSSREEAERTAEEARAYGVEAMTVQADVAHYDQVKRMAEEVRQKFGGVDILINSASIFQKTPFPLEDVELWHKVTAIQIDGSFYCANVFAPDMLKRGEGAIINIVDLSAWEPWPNFAAHSVGKAALLALTRQLALELAPAVRVNAIAPGPVLPPPDYDDAKIARTAKKTLLQRWGSPEDISHAVLFLVESNYITGDTIIVDGGERFAHRRTEEG